MTETLGVHFFVVQTDSIFGTICTHESVYKHLIIEHINFVADH